VVFRQSVPTSPTESAVERILDADVYAPWTRKGRAAIWGGTQGIPANHACHRPSKIKSLFRHRHRATKESA
jgi:hypothetical protein